MGPFDELFDLDHDGKLGAFERAMQMEFLDEFSKDDHDDRSAGSSRSWWEDDSDRD